MLQQLTDVEWFNTHYIKILATHKFYGLWQRFPNICDHGTLFNLVNIYRTHMFYGPPLIK